MDKNKFLMARKFVPAPKFAGRNSTEDYDERPV